MFRITDYPLLTFVISLAVLGLSAWFGAGILRRRRPLEGDLLDDFRVVQGAMLTLLALIIGFTFSMAIGRYDQRKNLEAAEANAIGTEFVRADSAPGGGRHQGPRAVATLHRRADPVLHDARHQEERRISARTARLQGELWLAVQPGATANPTPVMALVVNGMNDVLNSQGYTQAAWWNRIPPAAWLLMVLIAAACCVSVGYGSRGLKAKRFLLLAVPLIVCVSFFFIADIDSPRSGIIRVIPQNLHSLVDALGPK